MVRASLRILYGVGSCIAIPLDVVASEAIRQTVRLGRGVVTPTELLLAAVSVGHQVRITGDQPRDPALLAAPAALRRAGIDLPAALAWALASNPAVGDPTDRRPYGMGSDRDPAWSEEALRAIDLAGSIAGVAKRATVVDLVRALAEVSGEVRALLDSRGVDLDGAAAMPDAAPQPAPPTPDGSLRINTWIVEDGLSPALRRALDAGRSVVAVGDLSGPLVGADDEELANDEERAAMPDDRMRAEAAELVREVAWLGLRRMSTRKRPAVAPEWDPELVEAVAYALARPSYELWTPAHTAVELAGGAEPRGVLPRLVSRLFGPLIVAAYGSPAVGVITEEAARQAVRLGRDAVSPAEIFLAVVSVGHQLRVEGATPRRWGCELDRAAQLLANYGVDLRAALDWVASLTAPPGPPPLAEAKPPAVSEAVDPSWTVDAERCLGLARDIAASRGLRLVGGSDVLLAVVETWPPLAALLNDRGIDLIDLCTGGE